MPVALGVAAAIQFLVTAAVWRSIAQLGAHPAEWLIWLPRIISCPLMAAGFAITGVRMVPTRKEFIATCGLGVACVQATMLMFGNYAFVGRFMPWTFAMGSGWLLGGIATYYLQARRFIPVVTP